MNAKPTKDYVIRDLIEFFLQEHDNNPDEIEDWVAQGDFDCDEFVASVRKLKSELELRGFDKEAT